MTAPFFLLGSFLLAEAYPGGWEPLLALEANTGRLSLFGLEFPSPFLLTLLATLLFALATAAGFTFRLPQGPEGHRALARRVTTSRFFALLVYAACLFLFHYPTLLQFESAVLGTAIVSALLRLAPYLILEGAIQFFSTLREAVLLGESSVASLAAFRLRLFLGLGLIPLLFLLAALDVLRLVPGGERWLFVYPAAAQGCVLVFLGASLLAAPFLLRFSFSATSLPSGALREDLDAVCARTGFAARDLLVVPTPGRRLANAFVVGAFPGARYVFFTDTLLEALDPREIRAVLAHEIGHARHHHIPTLAAFSFSVAVFARTFESYLSAEESIAAALVPPLAASFWLAGFSFVSRGFEREADRFAVETTGDMEGMMSALLKVSAVNGASPRAGGLRHPSVASRLESLQKQARIPLWGQLEQFQHRLVRNLALWFFVASCSILFGDALRQHLEAPERLRSYEAWRKFEEGRAALMERGDRDRAVRLLREASEFSDDGSADLYLAWIDLVTDEAEARRRLDEAERKGLVDPWERVRCRQMRRYLSTAR